MNGVSLVLPTYNEEENLEILCQSIKKSMAPLNLPYELIFIEDGSTDNSFEILQKVQKDFPEMKIIKLKKRLGQGISLSIGFQKAEYNTIISLDSDMQDDPQDIPLFLKKMEEGYDLVCGWRKNRQDVYFPKIFISRIGNQLLKVLIQTDLHDSSCTFKAFKKEAAKKIAQKLRPGYHRYIPLIAKKLHLHSCEISTHHKPRMYGKSKYTLWKVFPALKDLILIHLTDFTFKKNLLPKNYHQYIEKIYKS